MDPGDVIYPFEIHKVSTCPGVYICVQYTYSVHSTYMYMHALVIECDLEIVVQR